jgi:hypothetical protein
MSSPSDFFNVIEFDYELEKKKFIDNMNLLKSMDVHEQTFYKKWYELQSYKSFVSNSSVTKSKIWKPTDINDEKETVKQLEEMSPTIEVVTSSTESDWLMLRLFCHTMEFSQTPGRFLKLIVHDGSDEKRLLGGISISSDVIAITDRDNYIGWTSDDRLKGDKKINNSAIGSCIMSTQPFGYNFLGGKLCASLVTTDVVRNVWKSQYNNVMAGMTTTSLYGSYSMYNSLKWWHKCGTSAGKMPIKPDDNVYEIWHHWLQENHPEEYTEMMKQKEGVSGPVTGAKQRVISKIFSQLGIKSSEYVHGFERGTYYSSFYENTREFLCNKVTESDLKLKPLYAEGKSAILNWWRPKAIDRYKKLKLESKLKGDILYYNDMIGMTYDEAKEKYLNEVGR